MRLARALIWMCLVATGLAACGDSNGSDDTADERTQVRFQASWIPDCQFAGYLMAAERGIYEDHGLDVEIVPGGPNVNPTQQVVTGAAEVTVNKVAALLAARGEGLPVKGIAQFHQVSSFPLVARAESGVSSPEDLRGKEIGIWYDGDEYEVLALLTQAGLDPQTDVSLFEQGFTMDSFLAGDYDVAMMTSFNDLQVMRLQGLDPGEELTVINPSDYGISIPHGAIIASEEWLADDRSAAAAFVDASIEGWQYAFDNKEETAAFCAESSRAAGGEAATTELEELQLLMLEEEENLHLPEGFSSEDMGRIDPEMYSDVADIMVEFGQLDPGVDVEESYDTTIWEES